MQLRLNEETAAANDAARVHRNSDMFQRFG